MDGQLMSRRELGSKTCAGWNSSLEDLIGVDGRKQLVHSRKKN